MQSTVTLVFAVICVLLVILLIKLLKTPLKWALKLILNMISGLVLLFIFNFIGGLFDFTLGLNVFNALVAGILGIPGVILLVLIKLFI
ncbi:MAG: pro-sigmaK processing inhibitor BofA [Clostridia bacterium]|nr:pro-sigmaK processing inhibitor BofA [Clostridia bacterium]